MMNLQLKKTINEYLKTMNIEDTVAVSLTMKQKVFNEYLTKEVAGKNLLYFRNTLNERLYGNAFKRYGKQVGIVPVFERSGNGRLHYHLLLEVPKDRSTVLYKHLIESCWNNTLFGHREIDIQETYSSQWIDYITKFKHADDDVDWDNLHWNRWL